MSDNLAQRGIAGLLIKPIDKNRMLTHVEAMLDLQEISRIYSDRESGALPPAEHEQEAPPPAAEVQQPEPQQPLKPVPEPPRQIRPDSHKEEGSATKPLVLVVNDEPDMRTLLSDLLNFSGFEVMTADDGVQGLKIAQQVMPQAILLDIMLPKLDGFQVCRLLKFNEKYAEIPIIMLTARNHPKDRELAEGAGANGYIVKPFETKDLIEELRKVMGAKAQHGSGAN